jgi:hypothetical protein
MTPKRHRLGRRGAIAVPVLLIVTLLAAACGRPASSASSSAGTISPTAGLVTTTPAGSKQVSSVTWAVYRDVESLDPMFAFDYPENTAISLMCNPCCSRRRAAPWSRDWPAWPIRHPPGWCSRSGPA